MNATHVIVEGRQMSAYSALQALEEHSARIRYAMTEQAKRAGAATVETPESWALAMDTDAQLAERIRAGAQVMREIMAALA